MLLDSLTISMFGLEKHLWDDIPKGEKNLYVLSFLFFLFFMLLSIASGITLLFLITSSMLISIPLGFILSLVVGSIVRFSLVILRKSIFDPEKIKPEKKAKISEENLGEENGNEKLNVIPVPKNLSSKIEKLKQKFSKIKFPKSETPIPILTSIIRFSILSVIGLLILFPLVCVLHFNKIEELNQSKRDSYISQHIKDTEESLEMKTAYLKKEIQKTQKEIYQQKGLLKDKKAQLNFLNQKLAGIIEKHNEEAEVNLNAYRVDIENRYFIVYTFKTVFKYSGFLLCTLLIVCILISPHFILYLLKTNKKFIYADLSTKYYKQLIEEKYQDNQKYILKFLQEKFQYTPPDGYETIIWSNPPYCTQKNIHFKVRNKLNKNELITSLIKHLF